MENCHWLVKIRTFLSVLVKFTDDIICKSVLFDYGKFCLNYALPLIQCTVKDK